MSNYRFKVSICLKTGEITIVKSVLAHFLQLLHIFLTWWRLFSLRSCKFCHSVDLLMLDLKTHTKTLNLQPVFFQFLWCQIFIASIPFGCHKRPKWSMLTTAHIILPINFCHAIILTTKMSASTFDVTISRVMHESSHSHP